MSIIEQAKLEIDAAGFGEDDKRILVEILEKFFQQWNSGGAVSVMAPVLQRLIAGVPLQPLTGNQDEWFDPMGDGISLQNTRCGSVFKSWRAADGSCSRIAGVGTLKTFDLDNPAWDGKFPYLPPSAEVGDPVMEF